MNTPLYINVGCGALQKLSESPLKPVGQPLLESVFVFETNSGVVMTAPTSLPFSAEPGNKELHPPMDEMHPLVRAGRG